MVRCFTYREEEVLKSVKEAVDLIGGIEKFVKPNSKILLKVNLLSARSPEKAVTTHPEIVRAVVRLVKERGGIPLIGDAASTGGMGLSLKREDAFRIAGFREIAEYEGAEIVNFNSAGYRKVSIPQSKRLKEVNLAIPVFEVDAIFSLPKLKTHELTFLTGAVKNFFGCIPASDRNIAHRAIDPRDFARAVVDIYSLCRPSLSIMDGITAMEGEGPSRGYPFSLGVVLASPSAVALDVVASQLIGYKPAEIYTTVEAIERGLGPEGLEKIEVLGAPLKELIRRDFKKPSGYRSLTRRTIYRILAPLGIRFFKVYPAADKRKCKKCGLCEERCPVEAIKLEPYPVIDYEKCIQCFTCHEVCEYEAMDLKRSWLARTFSSQ